MGIFLLVLFSNNSAHISPSVPSVSSEASSTISNPLAPASTSAVSSHTTKCTIPANPDLLGIGIRLGVYFQLVANVIIAIVKPEEGITSLTVSNIFFTGNLIALVYSIAQNSVPTKRHGQLDVVPGSGCPATRSDCRVGDKHR